MFFFKETYSGVYSKWPNFWIHNTDFNSHSFSNVRLIHYFLTHTQEEMGEFFFKETFSSV